MSKKKKIDTKKEIDIYLSHIKEDPKTGQKKLDKFTIQLNMFSKYLQNLGFCRFDQGNNSYLIRIQDNIIQEVKPHDIKLVVLEHISTLPNELHQLVLRVQLEEKILNSIPRLFNKDYLMCVNPTQPIEINEDTKETAYYYYNNLIVKVDKKGVKAIKYKDLKMMVWKHEIIDHDIKIEDFKKTASKFYLNTFLNNIANNNDGKSVERVQSLYSIIGYLAHRYYEGKLKALVLTDSRISEDGTPMGRSGKTLLGKIIGNFLNANKFSKTFVEQNGKDFDAKSSFKYQSLEKETRLVHINDITRNFPVENFFNDITEGIDMQKKNMGIVKVYAKLMISTNLTMNIEGDSAKDRFIEFEFADHYSASHAPTVDSGGQWYFTDWGQKEYNHFHNIMIHCVQVYLQNGIITPASLNLEKRKLYDRTSVDFIDYMKFTVEKKIKESGGVLMVQKNEFRNDFVKIYPDYDRKWFTINKINKWMEIYQEAFEYISIQSGRSNSLTVYKFKFNNQDLYGALEDDPTYLPMGPK